MQARNFRFVQPLAFDDNTHSNPTFPQEYSLVETKRLKPGAIKDLVFKTADRGVGGPPYQSVTTQYATAFLPLTPQAVASDRRGPRIDGIVASNTSPQLFGRYEMPRNRRMLSQNRPHAKANLFGDGILLFDRLGTPGVQQLNTRHPGKFSRYQIAGPLGPANGDI